jgi:hypothetical protein
VSRAERGRVATPDQPAVPHNRNQRHWRELGFRQRQFLRRRDQACVNDGTSLAHSDGDHTYVISTAAAGFHTVAYSGGPSGALSGVVVHIVAAAQAGASGTAMVSIYDGATLVGTGTAHALSGSYTEYVETFNVPSPAWQTSAHA